MRPTQKRLIRKEYLRWAGQEADRRGLIAGAPAATPERILPVHFKGWIRSALDCAVWHADLACEASGDGVIIQIDDETCCGSAGVMKCELKLGLGYAVAANPVIVVEVLSPATALAGRVSHVFCRGP